LIKEHLSFAFLSCSLPAGEFKEMIGSVRSGRYVWSKVLMTSDLCPTFVTRVNAARQTTVQQGSASICRKNLAKVFCFPPVERSPPSIRLAVKAQGQLLSSGRESESVELFSSSTNSLRTVRLDKKVTSRTSDMTISSAINRVVMSGGSG
jgi:hypothetical protein